MRLGMVTLVLRRGRAIPSKTHILRISRFPFSTGEQRLRPMDSSPLQHSRVLGLPWIGLAASHACSPFQPGGLQGGGCILAVSYFHSHILAQGLTGEDQRKRMGKQRPFPWDESWGSTDSPALSFAWSSWRWWIPLWGAAGHRQTQESTPGKTHLLTIWVRLLEKPRLTVHKWIWNKYFTFYFLYNRITKER